MFKKSKRWAALAVLLISSLVKAHELPANRLTLVMRDATHVSLTYFIDYPTVLHRALAPQKTLTEFVLMYSALPPADFQKAMLKAQAAFSAGTRLVLATSRPVKSKGQITPQRAPLTLTNWQWPDAKSTQSVLQQHAMQSIVGAGEHLLEIPFEIRAEATATQAIISLEVRLPEEMGKVMVVSYQPQQAWAEPKNAHLIVKF